MPTPPFSQDRRDWLSEISGLFSLQKTKNTGSPAKWTSPPAVNILFGVPKAGDSASTLSFRDDASAKDQAVAHGPRRSG